MEGQKIAIFGYLSYLVRMSDRKCASEQGMIMGVEHMLM
jgi:hypothetical protein